MLQSMPSNIEIKARLRDVARTQQLAATISDTPVERIEQHDTFYHAVHGRLKLRKFTPQDGVLIQYHRPDTAGTKQSTYFLAPTQDPEALHEVLAAALGVRQVVVKTRLLYMKGQTRIHLDMVEGLGSFLELEVVLREGQSPEEGHANARELMTALEIPDADLLEGAYADLLPQVTR